MAGYIGSKAVTLSTTAADVTGDATINGNLTVNGTTVTIDSAAAQEIRLGDNDKMTFGDATGGDLQIYHDGSMSYIDDAGNGDLRIRASNDINFRNYSNDATVMNLSLNNGSEFVQLYYAGSQKLATTTTGVDISGTLTSDGLTVDGTSQFDNYSSTSGKGRIQFGNSGQQYIEGYDTGNAGSGSYLSFGQGASERMRIDNSGNVGIGDSAPLDKLEVKTTTLGGITISSPTHNYAALSFARNSTATARIFISEPDVTHTSAIHLQTSDASGGPNLITAMTIDQNQNVGIGTSSPMVALNVHDSTNARIALTNSSTGQTFPDGFELLATGLDAYLQNRSNGNMIFTTNNAERMRIDQAGRVTMPYQPVFSYLGSHTYSIATTGTQTMSSSNVWAASVNHALNRGSHFNPSTGRFTAPIAGTYHFQFTCTASEFNSGYLWFYMSKNGSAKSYVQASQQTEHTMIVHNFYFDLSANDYVSVQWTNNYVSGKINYPGFSGYLVG